MGTHKKHLSNGLLISTQSVFLEEKSEKYQFLLVKKCFILNFGQACKHGKTTHTHTRMHTHTHTKLNSKEEICSHSIQKQCL